MIRKRNLDGQGRLRSMTIAFRISPEENELVNERVRLSNMTKQDYITLCLLGREIIANPNPYAYNRLKEHLDRFILRFYEIHSIEDLSIDELDILEVVLSIIKTTKENKKTKIKINHDARPNESN